MVVYSTANQEDDPLSNPEKFKEKNPFLQSKRRMCIIMWTLMPKNDTLYLTAYICLIFFSKKKSTVNKRAFLLQGEKESARHRSFDTEWYYWLLLEISALCILQKMLKIHRSKPEGLYSRRLGPVEGQFVYSKRSAAPTEFVFLERGDIFYTSKQFEIMLFRFWLDSAFEPLRITFKNLMSSS